VVELLSACSAIRTNYTPTRGIAFDVTAQCDGALLGHSADEPVGNTNGQRMGSDGERLQACFSAVANRNGAVADRDGAVTAAASLRGGAVFRWESAGAGVLILASFGCSVTAPAVTQYLPGLAQLQQLVPTASPIGYRGNDQRFHYFCVPAGEAYAIPLASWNVTSMPVSLGFCIPLWFQLGRLVVPPSEWSSQADLMSMQWALRD
jgi:hypothetical protein